MDTYINKNLRDHLCGFYELVKLLGFGTTRITISNTKLYLRKYILENENALHIRIF